MRVLFIGGRNRPTRFGQTALCRPLSRSGGAPLVAVVQTTGAVPDQRLDEECANSMFSEDHGNPGSACASRSPWQRAYVDRVIGRTRRTAAHAPAGTGSLGCDTASRRFAPPVRAARSLKTAVLTDVPSGIGLPILAPVTRMSLSQSAMLRLYFSRSCIARGKA